MNDFKVESTVFMTNINNIEIRSDIQKASINKNIEKLNNAIKSNLLFAVDEYIVSIFNTFFSDSRSVPGDEIILNELLSYSIFLGNERNARIIKQELDNIGQKLKSSTKNYLTFPLKVILPENIRTKLKSLKTITKNYELGVENKYEETDFDYNKYIDDFDDRFWSAKKSYKRISTENSSSFLDIGTGMGYIPYVFKHNGYNVTCFDMVGCADIFNKSCEILGIKKHHFTINKYETLINFNKKFDIINSSLICFNKHKEKDLWLKDEWFFFLNDIYNNQLSDEGILYLGFNSEVDNNFYLGNDVLHNIFDPYIDNKTAILNKNDIRKILNI